MIISGDLTEFVTISMDLQDGLCTRSSHPNVSRGSGCILKIETGKQANPKNSNCSAIITRYFCRMWNSNDRDFYWNFFLYFLFWVTTRQGCNRPGVTNSIRQIPTGSAHYDMFPGHFVEVQLVPLYWMVLFFTVYWFLCGGVCLVITYHSSATTHI